MQENYERELLNHAREVRDSNDQLPYIIFSEEGKIKYIVLDANEMYLIRYFL